MRRELKQSASQPPRKRHKKDNVGTLWILVVSYSITVCFAALPLCVYYCSILLLVGVIHYRSLIFARPKTTCFVATKLSAKITFVYISTIHVQSSQQFPVINEKSPGFRIFWGQVPNHILSHVSINTTIPWTLQYNQKRYSTQKCYNLNLELTTQQFL